MLQFFVGQRWISETEPELGLGQVIEIDSKTIKVDFPLSDEVRTYGQRNAPLKRVAFEAGDTIKVKNDQGTISLIVEEVKLKDELFVYLAQGIEYSEILLSDQLQFSKPEERFLNGLIDSDKLFHLRIETLHRKAQILSGPERGLMGGKISLIPHQLYVAQKVAKLRVPRVLLADEVGLGKTIEACLIIHRLLLTHQVQRVMILLPDSLVHQWFFELYRKFSLSFTMINQETTLEKGSNPFCDNERVIVSMGLLKGAPLAQELLAQAKFDLLIVDEAHALKSQGTEDNFEFKLVTELSQRIPGLVMLTATPEQFGVHDHFRRLQLIDPQKYNDFDHYQQERQKDKETADFIKELAKFDSESSLENQGLSDAKLNHFFTESEQKRLSISQAITVLADRHGTGRSYMRNVRKSMDREFLFFPKRLLYPQSLDLGPKMKMTEPLRDHEIDQCFKLKFDWLHEQLLGVLRNHKVLLICKSKKKVLELEQLLKKTLSDIKLATFHSDLSLMARDRQAAYFADPKGAQILLCTEVGSEGRNFEFCQHLVLFDLPLHPHPLEQRIGRLDRIGQKRDIHLHLPYFKETWEEVLFRWYHEGMNVFEASTESSGRLYDELRDDLIKLLAEPEQAPLENFIAKTQQRQKEIEKELQEGRDILVEKNSFNHQDAMSITKSISKLDASDDLSEYLDRVFDCFGVDVEDIEASTWYVKPSDNMFVPAFPHLDAEGKTFTFSRTKALEREDYDFLTWDHPLVLGVMDLIISQNFGSNTLVMRPQRKAGTAFYFEAFYTFECPASKKLQLEKFGLGKTMRFLIDDKGQDLSDKWTPEMVNEKTVAPSQELLQAMKGFPRDRLLALKGATDKKASQLFEQYKNDFIKIVTNYFDQEQERLEELATYQKSLAQRELTGLRELREASLAALNEASFRFDAFRIIA